MSRDTVVRLSRFGVLEETIAKILDMPLHKLQTMYEKELLEGKTIANAEIAEKAFCSLS